jgi:hypothetical protein
MSILAEAICLRFNIAHLLDFSSSFLDLLRRDVAGIRLLQRWIFLEQLLVEHLSGGRNDGSCAIIRSVKEVKNGKSSGFSVMDIDSVYCNR